MKRKKKEKKEEKMDDKSLSDCQRRNHPLYGAIFLNSKLKLKRDCELTVLASRAFLMY